MDQILAVESARPYDCRQLFTSMPLPAFHRRVLYPFAESERRTGRGAGRKNENISVIFNWLHTCGMLWVESLCLYFLTSAGPRPVQSSWSGRFVMQVGWVGRSCFHANVGAAVVLRKALRKLQDGKLECRIMLQWPGWIESPSAERERACQHEGSNIQLQVSMHNPILWLLPTVFQEFPNAYSAHWWRKPVLFAKESSAPQQGP